MAKYTISAESGDITNQQLELTQRQYEIFQKWDTLVRNISNVVNLANSGEMSKEDYSKSYQEYEQSCQDMRTFGIFDSKYQFRSSWVLV